MNAAARARFWAYGFSAALIFAVLLPLLGDPSSDSFPFSTYPMFSGRRSADVSIPHIVAFKADGSREPLPPAALGTDEVVQAFESIRQAIRQGDASLQALCSEAAAWASDQPAREAVSVAVVTDSYNALRYFEGDTTPVSTSTHAKCDVAR